MKVLLVEDEDVLREAVAGILEVKAYDYLAVSDGQYAWEALPTYQPDLIITDIKMPRMTGLELLEKVQNSEFATIPAIVMSAYALKEYMTQAETLNVFAYLTKPFSLIEMVNTIESIFDKSLCPSVK